MAPLRARDVAFFVFKNLAWTPYRTKHFAVPIPETAPENKILLKYWARTKKHGSYSFLQWLCEFEATKTLPKQYAKGLTVSPAWGSPVF